MKLRKALKTLSLIILITACLFLLCVELYSHYRIYHYKHSDDKADYYLQQMLLYQDVNHFMDKRNHDDLNSDNIRYHKEAINLRADDLNFIFLGDSFVYGFLLSHRAAMPYQFEEIAQKRFPKEKINGVNFGWVSASPYVEFNLLKKLGDQYQPDVVILDLDLGDFHDDLRYQIIDKRKSIYRFAGILPFTTLFFDTLALKLEPDTYEKLLGFPKSQLFVNERPVEKNIPYMHYTFNNLDAINEYVTKELGAKFVVFVNPKTFHYNEKESPNNWMKHVVKKTPYSYEIFGYIDMMAAKRPYPIISLLPAFQRTTVFPTAFDKDAHWNRAGYKIASEEMVEQCIKLGCFE